MDTKYLQKRIVVFDSNRWTIFRYIQLAITVLGMSLFLPIEPSDSDQSILSITIHENLSQMSLVVGLFYCLIFQESFYRGLVVICILAINEVIKGVSLD
jgi:hypothetical protein